MQCSEGALSTYFDPTLYRLLSTERWADKTAMIDFIFYVLFSHRVRTTTVRDSAQQISIGEIENRVCFYARFFWRGLCSRPSN